MTSKARPSRLSMEGYVFNANSVLETALDPKTRQVPVELVEKCKGVVVLTIHSGGAIVTLVHGTGIMMRKMENGEWSPPTSVSIGGTSFGAVVGVKRDDTLIFIMDEESMKDFVERPQSRIALDAALTAGTFGGDANIGMELPNKGTITVPFTKGAFVGFSVEMASLETRADQNKVFYGKHVPPKDILSGKVEIPPDSQVADIHEKMSMLAKGETWVPTKEDLDRSHHFAEAALQSSELFKASKQ